MWNSKVIKTDMFHNFKHEIFSFELSNLSTSYFKSPTQRKTERTLCLCPLKIWEWTQNFEGVWNYFHLWFFSKTGISWQCWINSWFSGECYKMDFYPPPFSPHGNLFRSEQCENKTCQTVGKLNFLGFYFLFSYCLQDWLPLRKNLKTIVEIYFSHSI